MIKRIFTLFLLTHNCFTFPTRSDHYFSSRWSRQSGYIQDQHDDLTRSISFLSTGYRPNTRWDDNEEPYLWKRSFYDYSDDSNLYQRDEDEDLYQVLEDRGFPEGSFNKALVPPWVFQGLGRLDLLSGRRQKKQPTDLETGLGDDDDVFYDAVEDQTPGVLEVTEKTEVANKTEVAKKTQATGATRLSQVVNGWIKKQFVPVFTTFIAINKNQWDEVPLAKRFAYGQTIAAGIVQVIMAGLLSNWRDGILGTLTIFGMIAHMSTDGKGSLAIKGILAELNKSIEVINKGIKIMRKDFAGEQEKMKNEIAQLKATVSELEIAREINRQITTALLEAHKEVAERLAPKEGVAARLAPNKKAATSTTSAGLERPHIEKDKPTGSRVAEAHSNNSIRRPEATKAAEPPKTPTPKHSAKKVRHNRGKP